MPGRLPRGLACPFLGVPCLSALRRTLAVRHGSGMSLTGVRMPALSVRGPARGRRSSAPSPQPQRRRLFRVGGRHAARAAARLPWSRPRPAAVPACTDPCRGRACRLQFSKRPARSLWRCPAPGPGTGAMPSKTDTQVACSCFATAARQLHFPRIRVRGVEGRRPKVSGLGCMPRKSVPNHRCLMLLAETEAWPGDVC
jgi:hypothetical protein